MSAPQAPFDSDPSRASDARSEEEARLWHQSKLEEGRQVFDSAALGSILTAQGEDAGRKAKTRAQRLRNSQSGRQVFGGEDIGFQLFPNLYTPELDHLHFDDGALYLGSPPLSSPGQSTLTAGQPQPQYGQVEPLQQDWNSYGGNEHGQYNAPNTGLTSQDGEEGPWSEAYLGPYDPAPAQHLYPSNSAGYGVGRLSHLSQFSTTSDPQSSQLPTLYGGPYWQPPPTWTADTDQGPSGGTLVPSHHHQAISNVTSQENVDIGSDPFLPQGLASTAGSLAGLRTEDGGPPSAERKNPGSRRSCGNCNSRRKGTSCSDGKKGQIGEACETCTKLKETCRRVCCKQ